MKQLKLDWAASLIAKQSGFAKAKIILEIGGGSFRRVVSLAKAYPEKLFYSIDMEYSRQAVETVMVNAGLRNVNIVKVNANTPIFTDELFDFIFSSAVMEHIAEIDDFLREMYRITRRGGEHYFIQSPFWTSYKGHHYRHAYPAIVKILGGYKHILYDENEMRAYLALLPQLPFEVDECIWRIYHRRDLSRLSRNETYQKIVSSSFQIIEWRDIEDECFDADSASMVVSKGTYSLQDMKIKGACVSLRKR
jgi:ubiquinone/menaquinone biosynthesis C-methylase UbiE